MLRSRSRNTNDTLPASPSFTTSATSTRFKLNLLLQRAVEDAWLAGETIRGMLEVAVTGSQDIDDVLELGEIGVELSGYEELRSRDHTSTRRLLSQRVDFQGGSLPPSNAVQPTPSLTHRGFYPALRGKTRFPFAFKVPRDATSSCSLGGNAATRYELRAFASSATSHGGVEVRSEKRPVMIVERWADWHQEQHGEWHKPFEKKISEKVKRGVVGAGPEGQVVLAVACGRDAWSETPLRLFWRGDPEIGAQGKGQIELRVRVRNATPKHISGLKVNLCRRLRILESKPQQVPSVAPPSITSFIHTQRLHGVDYEFPPGEEKEVSIHLALPSEECWTKRKGVLFELDVLARVQVESAYLAKDLFVEVPVWVAHPASLPPAAHEHITDQLRLDIPPPMLPAQPAFPRSPSAMSNYALHSPDSDPYHRPSPGPTGYHSASSSAVGTTDARRSPSIPAPLQDHHARLDRSAQLPKAYVAFNTDAPDLTQSTFLQTMQTYQAQQVWVPPNSAMSIPLGAPPSPSTIGFAPPPPLLSPPPPGSAAEQTRVFSNSFAPPPRAHFVPASASHPSPISPAVAQAMAFVSPEHRDIVAHNMRPLEPYNAMQRGLSPSKSPQHAPQPMPATSAASQASSLLHRSHSTNSLRSQTSRSTPPPALSAAVRCSPTLACGSAPASTYEDNASLLGLDTIGEDGESQAGSRNNTAQSTNLGPGVLAALAAGHDLPSPQGRPGIGSRRTSAQDLEEIVAAEEERVAQEQTDKATQEASAEHIVRDTQRPSPHEEIVALPRTRLETPSVRSSEGLSALEARLSHSGSQSVTPETRSTRAISPAVTSFSSSASSRSESGTAKALTGQLSTSKGPTSATGPTASEVQPPIEETVKVSVSSPTKKHAPRPTFTSKRLVATSPTDIAATPDSSQVPRSPTIALDAETGRQIVNVAEHTDLKQEAAGRVAGWLHSAPTPDASAGRDFTSAELASDNTFIKPLKRRTIDLTIHREAPQPPSSTEGTTASPWTSSSKRRGAAEKTRTETPSEGANIRRVQARHKYTKSEPTMVQLLESNDEPGMVNAIPIRRSTKLLDLSNQQAQDNEDDIRVEGVYAHKSARGGKGGVVTHVAQVWANRTDETSPAIQNSQALKMAPSAPLASGKSLTSVGNFLRFSPLPTAPSEATLAAPKPTPKLAKRLSDPARAAKPFLNTTVGRNVVLSGAVRTQPSMTSLRGSASSPQVNVTGLRGTEDKDKRVGSGNKVKELMARYKQQVEAHQA